MSLLITRHCHTGRTQKIATLLSTKLNKGEVENYEKPTYPPSGSGPQN